MGRVRVFALLLSLLMLSGCIGLFGGTTTRITGTVRIDTSSGASAESIAPSSVAARFLGMPAGGAVFTPSIHMTEPTPQAVPVEVLLYADRLSGAEARGLAEQHGFTYLRSSQDGYHVLRDRMGRSEARAISDIKGAAGGARVEPNRPVYLLSVNDYYFENGDQWALDMINVVPAWDLVDSSSPEVIVAIVDTGIEFDHPDLAADGLWVPGFNFADSAEGEPYGRGINDFDKAHYHGTMVAGIIAAITDNEIGIAGTVGPTANVKLMPIRVFGNIDPRQETIARAIEWAVDNGADVINLSVGDRNCTSATCPQPDSRLERALDYAWREGVTVVAAAGNNGTGVILPANYRTTIAVGALDAGKGKAPYSSVGDELDITAPGGAGGPNNNCSANVVSLRTGKQYRCDDNGTSIAAPHVSGILALMIARYRALGLDYGPDDLRQILQITATDLKTPGWDKDTGYGLVNAHAAVTAGVPRIFVAKKSDDALEAPHAPVRSQLGGVFTLSGMPEGTWSLFGWVDSDMSGTVNDGDYFQEYGLVNVKKGKNVSVTLVLTRYDGDELNVNW